MKTNMQSQISRAETSQLSLEPIIVPQSSEMDDAPSSARGILMEAAFHEPPCTTIPELRMLLEGLSEAVSRVAPSHRGIPFRSNSRHQLNRALFVQSVDEREWTELSIGRKVSNRSTFLTTETLVLPSKEMLASLDDSAPNDPLRRSVFHSYYPMNSFESGDDIRILFPFVVGRTAVADRMIADHYSRRVQGMLAAILGV